MTKFNEKKLLIASGNKGKILEISNLLEPFKIDVVSAADYKLDEPEENGSTFIENAEIKSRYYSKATGLPALADDSGLCVDALNGAPGIYSARWAGQDKDYSAAMERIKVEMGNSENKNARFICALSLYFPETGIVDNFEGVVEGQIYFPAKGENGFGYDPIFIAAGMTETFAEIAPQQKHSLSHRADAFNKLINKYFL